MNKMIRNLAMGTALTLGLAACSDSPMGPELDAPAEQEAPALEGSQNFMGPGGPKGGKGGWGFRSFRTTDGMKSDTTKSGHF